LLYTDHVLASLIAKLQSRADRVDSAMLFVSDHGESLGERGLFLHGMPYAIAPREQTEVPMVAWFSGGWPAATGLDLDCLRGRTAEPASHDHLFHTTLGLLGVSSRVFDPAWDLTAPCRTPLARPSTP
jgi:lipid A ethanolaminephosphotransferase